MRKKLRIFLIVAGCLFLLVLVGLYLLYRGTQYVPEEYIAVLEADPVEAAEAKDEALRQAAALQSNVKKPGRWRALFTQEQLNGWLAVDLPQNHADALPDSVSDPRVVIEPEQVTLFCRVEMSGVTTVASLTVQPHVPEPNILAVRICKARAGSVPMPLGEALDRLSDIAGRAGYHLQWQQADGDPVAVLTVPPPRSDNGIAIQIDTLELDDGELYLSGTTERN